jgi:hypothetical protein
VREAYGFLVATPGNLGDVESGSRTLRLTADELAHLADCVVETATEDERPHAERLLGQLATLRLISGGQPITFVPFPGTDALARRALDALRARDAREARRVQRTRRLRRAA